MNSPRLCRIFGTFPLLGRGGTESSGICRLRYLCHRWRWHCSYRNIFWCVYIRLSVYSCVNSFVRCEETKRRGWEKVLFPWSSGVLPWEKKQCLASMTIQSCYTSLSHGFIAQRHSNVIQCISNEKYWSLKVLIGEMICWSHNWIKVCGEVDTQYRQRE